MRLGMPGRVLITRPTFPGGGQVPGTSNRPRGLRHNDLLPEMANKESRTKHLSGVARATSQRSRLFNITTESPTEHLNGVTATLAHNNSRESGTPDRKWCGVPMERPPGKDTSTT